MVSPAFLLITCLLSLSSAKHKHDRSQRANLAAWKTTECAILNGQHTEPCPSPDSNGEWPCIRYSDLCNGQRDCPNGEDESAVHCYFHELHRAELDAIREKTHRMIVEFNRRTKPL
ncbi:unnamed protein product [Cylicocyclus nassatus]|uniref:Uncharacterized protein n=1 Tax=Cylicocyclus nassatus TaxID=53992 RepID=A0AA36DKH1_CYLNA|nr:unnamed protein product [Cylicocyclus nassatus]